MNYCKHYFKGSMLSIASAIILATLPSIAQSAEKIKTVATFSILGDMVKRIGGEHVVVTSLVGPDGDTHVYRPTPAAAKAMSDAALLVVNGLSFEGWLDRLVESSGFDGHRVVATAGVQTISYEEGGSHDDHDKDKHDDHAKGKHDDHAKDKHDDHAKGKHDDHDKDKHDDHAKDKHDDHDKDKHDDHAKGKHDDHHGHDHGEFDPHAWQSLSAALIYVNNITAALAQVAPNNAKTFYQNRAAYITEIKKLDKEIREMIEGLPQNRRIVVTSHDAFQYFGREYGLTFLAPHGLSTESEASAKDIANLIKQMRARKISAVFVENITDPRLMQQIAEETGATVGGKLYTGALSGPNGPASTYLEMIRHNATTLTGALKS